MTSRVRTLTVVLENDVRTDDAETIAQLLRRIQGVCSVTPGPVVDVNDLIARSQVRRKLANEILDLIKDEP